MLLSKIKKQWKHLIRTNQSCNFCHPLRNVVISKPCVERQYFLLVIFEAKWSRWKNTNVFGRDSSFSGGSATTHSFFLNLWGLLVNGQEGKTRVAQKPPSWSIFQLERIVSFLRLHATSAHFTRESETAATISRQTESEFDPTSGFDFQDNRSSQAQGHSSLIHVRVPSSFRPS